METANEVVSHIWRASGLVQGACDGGLDVPHKDKRFPGFMDDGKGPKLDPEIHRKYIFGGHVGEYMEVREDRWHSGCGANEQVSRYRHGQGLLQGLEAVSWRRCEIWNWEISA